ncbi:hypothetical protein EJ08DRAFT_489190 [Tothia fuscella]|uniref:Uncharacterized protein n=1 Tax=Tothia fuscella TaxID=1048955 RepID=A0A9P4TUF3_9PEZI|nr:hypothetical protein EJ08DRAFT_489190 [Tothia fuscella]
MQNKRPKFNQAGIISRGHHWRHERKSSNVLKQTLERKQDKSEEKNPGRKAEDINHSITHYNLESIALKPRRRPPTTVAEH